MNGTRPALGDRSEATRERHAAPLDRTLAAHVPAPSPQVRPVMPEPNALGATMAGPGVGATGSAAAAVGPQDRAAPTLGPSGTMVRGGSLTTTADSALGATIVGDGVGASMSLRSRIEAEIFPVPGQPGKINRFNVLRLLGEGGMGVVYAAFDEELDRRVAIKLVRDDGDDGSFGRSRILREAQAMAKVSHPNVVQVYEVGEFAGQVYVAMEFVKGLTLTDWLAEERRWEDVRDMFLQAGRGLAAAHAQGLVHRDFKPDNVLVGADGRARVLDFGLARRELELGARRASDSMSSGGRGAAVDVLSTNLTLAGTIMGTPAYMSPEQHLGEPADARSDQYSFCVALMEGIYGVHPFPGDTYEELREAALGGLRRPPPRHSAPAWLIEALNTGMAVDPNDRHPSMDTLLAALARDSAQPPARSRWLWPALTVATAVAAVALTLVLVGDPAPSASDAETIARLETEAREAAQRQLWVYPTPDAPGDTAYSRIVALEGISGDAATAARAAAAALRLEFAESLVVRGDELFEDPGVRSFARDYYVQALLFAPEHQRAGTRAGVSLGQLAELQERAKVGEFLEGEVIVGEVQRALGEDDPRARSVRVTALISEPLGSTPSAEVQVAQALLRRGLISVEGLQGAVAAAMPARPVDEGEAAAVDDADDAVVEPESAAPPVVATKTGGRRDRKEKGAAKGSGEEEEAGVSDPVRSMELARQGEAARRRGELTEAEQLFNQALSLWNSNAAALSGLSDLYFDRGSFDRAVKYAERAVRAEGEKAEYRIGLGDALFKVFRYADAQKQYERAAALGHPKAAERLARVKAKVGE
jgi:tetratricopeptide (TPR) repeat protein/predicted Ser/Thr protein kinase